MSAPSGAESREGVVGGHERRHEHDDEVDERGEYGRCGDGESRSAEGDWLRHPQSTLVTRGTADFSIALAVAPRGES